MLKRPEIGLILMSYCAVVFAQPPIARVGNGGSFGSRGSMTYSDPPTTSASPIPTNNNVSPPPPPPSPAVVKPPATAHSTADDETRRKHALATIQTTAKEICGEVATEGTTEGKKVTVGIKAQLSGLARRLAELGIGGDAEYSSANYAGVLQKDLAVALEDNQKCRIHIFDKLVGLMLR